MNFLHERDFGDIILSLAVVKAATTSKSNYYIQNNPNAVKLLSPLIEFQTYIDKCCSYKNQNIDESFVDFRRGGLEWGKQLIVNHARWVKQEVDLSQPWLTAPVDKKYKGSIIVNKTQRYANPLFPWSQLVKILGDKMLFVGHENEYDIFCKKYGEVERLIINDYLELATAINSSDCFIGNQSSANCVAEGLKHKTIQEVCLWQPDCIYKRDNAAFCYDGTIDTTISGIDIEITREIQKLDKHESPPGGWKLTTNVKTLRSYAIDVLINEARNNGVVGKNKEIEEMIISETSNDHKYDPIVERFMHDIKRVEELLQKT
jgi:hypothetical protein